MNKEDLNKSQELSNVNGINRRDFLTKSAMAAAGVALAPAAWATASLEHNITANYEAGISQKEMMERRKLGKLEVSALGLGVLPFVGFYGGPKSRKEMIKIVRTAYENGVTFFDTAEAYGPLLDEEILGEAVAPFRKEVVVTSKFGFNIDPVARKSTREKNSRPEHIKKAIEGSLMRLKSDYVDLYYQHRVDPAVPIEDVAGAIKDLIQEGKVKHWGLSEPGLNTIRRAHSVQPLTAIQNEYSLWAREVETSVLPICGELGIGFVPWCPLGYGFLAGAVTEDTILAPGDFRWNTPRVAVTENLKQNLKLLDYINEWSKRMNATPAQISLAWLLAQKPWIVPIPGTTQLAHLKENIKTSSVKFTVTELKQFTDGLSQISIAGKRNSDAILQDIGVEAPIKK